MALDGFTIDVADTPRNERAFGRPGTRRAPGAFPQARVLALCERQARPVYPSGEAHLVVLSSADSSTPQKASGVSEGYCLTNSRSMAKDSGGSRQ